MRSIGELGLLDSELDDIFVFCRFGDRRRAVITGDYSSSSEYLDRLLTRSFGRRSPSLGPSLNKLGESGQVLAISVGRQWVGLMRPKLLGDPDLIRTIAEPFLICFEAGAGAPAFPVLTSSREIAVGFVTELQLERDIDKQRWRGYDCERLRGSLESLLRSVREGELTTYPTILKRELAATLQSANVWRDAA